MNVSSRAASSFPVISLLMLTRAFVQNTQTCSQFLINSSNYYAAATLRMDSRSLRQFDFMVNGPFNCIQNCVTSNLHTGETEGIAV
jgi:hypothetical protein